MSRLVLIALASFWLTGCFVLEELRKGDALIEQHSSRWREKKAADEAAQAEAAREKAAKSGPPVEASIALSIVFVASEIMHSQRGEAGLTERYPWMVAFIFGLLHGLGFAGALAQIGLPQTSIPAALLFFNVGVEIGQLVFIACVLVAVALARTTTRHIDLTRLTTTWTRAVPPYVIGSLAAFWTIQRLAAF